MFRGMIIASIGLILLSVGHAAELDGVVMPETGVANGTQVRLNGIGLRTYSILCIRIYVAGLYLERRSDNSDAILRSTEVKLLDIRFLRDVDAENARKAWRDGFEGNCKTPCYLDPSDVQRFLAAELASAYFLAIRFTARMLLHSLNQIGISDCHLATLPSLAARAMTSLLQTAEVD